MLRAPLLLVPVELKRKSLIEGFQLRRLDEETRLNVTLMEMLRQHFKNEIPGLEPLPEDGTGVVVAGVFRIFREAVRDLAGWEAKNDIWLGQFSFTKFLLWNPAALRDLRQHLGGLFAEGLAAFAPGTAIGGRLSAFASAADCSTRCSGPTRCSAGSLATNTTVGSIGSANSTNASAI